MNCQPTENLHWEERSWSWILAHSVPRGDPVWIRVYQKVCRRRGSPKFVTFPSPIWWQSSSPLCTRHAKSLQQDSWRPKQRIRRRHSSSRLGGQWTRHDWRHFDLRIFSDLNLGFEIPIVVSERRKAWARPDLRHSTVSVTLMRWCALIMTSHIS